MGLASYFEDIQDARGEPEKEQPYRTLGEWLEEARPHLDEVEKSLSEEELLDRVKNILICLCHQNPRRACPKKDDSRDVMMWQVFVREGSTKQEEKRAATITDDERVKVSEFVEQSAHRIPYEERYLYYIGTLGEVAFAKFLRTKGKNSPSIEGIFAGREFQTSDGKPIKVTTPSKEHYTRVLVRRDGYEQEPKDYYVGVRIFDSERASEVKGFAECKDLKEQSDIDDLPYGIEFDSLRPITELLDMMDNA